MHQKSELNKPKSILLSSTAHKTLKNIARSIPITPSSIASTSEDKVDAANDAEKAKDDNPPI
jgi:hypothetical protein